MSLKRSVGVGEPCSRRIVAGNNPLPQEPDAQTVQSNTQVVWSVRLLYLGLFVIGFFYYDLLQTWVDELWNYLLSVWVFNCVYFETWWTTVNYAIFLPIPWVMTKFRCFDKYKIDIDMKWQSSGCLFYLLDSVIYTTPLMILDTFVVKKYYGVDPSEWISRRRHYIQSTRALPSDPPSVIGIVGCIIGAFLIYDLIFFLFHYGLHKNIWFYKSVHSCHHKHSSLHAQVTNQLSLVERIALVLLANQSAKIVHSHPLTRAFFVPFFVGWLIENHSGFNVPWTLDKVVPFGLVGGSPAHFVHHVNGSRNYQPFFTYIDRFILTPRLKEEDEKD